MIKKSIKDRIMEHFFKFPTTKLRVRQIEREVKVPLPSAIRYVKELISERILKKTVLSNVTFFSANRSSNQYLIKKKLYNINKLYEIGLVKTLKEEYGNPTVVLFGSFSRGEDMEKSDVDLYVEPKVKNMDLTKFEKKLGKEIQVFSHNTILSIKNKHLTNNIINGFVLNGYLEVFK